LVRYLLLPDGTTTVTSLLRPHKKTLAIAFLAAVGESVASLLEPWPLKMVLDDVLRSKEIHDPLRQWFFSMAGNDKMMVIKMAAIASLLIASLDALCSYCEKYLTTSTGQWVLHDLRSRLYEHIQKLSLSFHDQRQSGDLLNRVTSDIDAIQSFISSGLIGSLINCLTLFGMVGLMFYLNWKFTLIALSVAPPLGFIVFHYTRLIKKSTRAVKKKEGEIISVINEVLSSMRTVKAFAREEYEQRRLEDQSLEGVAIAMKSRGLKARLAPIVEIIVAIGTAVVLWFGGRLVLSGELSAGSLVVFILYLGKMYKPMQELSKMTDSYSKASVGYERIREVLDTKREVKDLPGARKAGKLKGEIEFEHVSFEYEPRRPILSDVSFQVQPGQVAAFVGPTGAGKTTIISLIPRFYEVVSGVVKVDGLDVRQYTQKSLREQMSFVLQDTLLFHGPIWQNIAYGKPEASREEIIRAAELANAHEFIEKMPEGYDTIVGERGATLSGGQRQRISIARAVIRETPILILDEPSSGLDAASEQLVFEALDRLMQDKTAIVIAHRLSTIQRADIIFVLNDGVIVEAGNHSQLLRAGGLYATLHEIQFRDTADLGAA
jgi:subfamily B ATP-binding cassette protein MsbA